MKTIKKILMVMPILPFPPAGAEQTDRARGITQLREMGFEIRVITKLAAWQSSDYVAEIEQELGVRFIPVSYKYSNKQLSVPEKIKKFFLKLKNPFLLDGAALEYAEPEIKNIFAAELQKWQPDLIWFDYTYLWPLYKMARKNKIPIIARSINFEPSHFLQEDGYTPINLLKSVPKFLSEFITVRRSDIILAITPQEEKIYRRMGAKAATLPLRGLPFCLRNNHPIRERETLQVFFMGSTYNVAHNRRALEFIIKNLAPQIEARYPGFFYFNILGSKIPPAYEKYFKDNVKYGGALYRRDLEEFLSGMDIALIPSFFGAGMQQKIFEPLARAIPTITSARGLAGYPFEDKKHLFLADDLEGFISALLSLRDARVRQTLSLASSKISRKIFSKAALDEVVRWSINELSEQKT